MLWLGEDGTIIATISIHTLQIWEYADRWSSFEPVYWHGVMQIHKQINITRTKRRRRLIAPLRALQLPRVQLIDAICASVHHAKHEVEPARSCTRWRTQEGFEPLFLLADVALNGQAQKSAHRTQTVIIPAINKRPKCIGVAYRYGRRW